MPSQLLEAVRIGADALRLAHENNSAERLMEAFAILGPGGDGFVDFSYVRRTRGGHRSDEWLKSGGVLDLTSFSSMMKELYPAQAVADMAISPFFGIDRTVSSVRLAGIALDGEPMEAGHGDPRTFFYPRFGRVKRALGQLLRAPGVVT